MLLYTSQYLFFWSIEISHVFLLAPTPQQVRPWRGGGGSVLRGFWKPNEEANGTYCTKHSIVTNRPKTLTWFALHADPKDSTSAFIDESSPIWLNKRNRSWFIALHVAFGSAVRVIGLQELFQGPFRTHVRVDDRTFNTWQRGISSRRLLDNVSLHDKCIALPVYIYEMILTT